MTTTSYQVTIGERMVRVAVRREAERVLVRVDDQPEQPVELSRVHGALRSLVLGERRIELLAALTDEGATLTIDGLEYAAAVVDEARARLASVAGARSGSHVRRELKAPMPGLLAKVLVAVGETVEAGQPLAVLQAMKMENELSLARAGTVVAVSAEPGATVEQGQVLLVIE